MRLLPRFLEQTLAAYVVALCATVCSAVGEPVVVSGNAFLAEVLATLEGWPTITGQLRYKVRLTDQTLVGSGRYWQQGSGNGRRTRWETQTQVAGETASMLQVFDGTHLWTDRRLPSDRQIRRLDVIRLQAGLEIRGFGELRSQTTGTRLGELLATAQGRGGVPQLLAELLRRFEFDPPRAAQLNGTAVYALIGRWRPEELSHLWPERVDAEADSAAPWPEQLPDHVLLLVGKRDYFPNVIEFRRKEDADLADRAAGLRLCDDPLVFYELFDVKFGEMIDRRLFEFTPGDAQWKDETAVVLKQLRR